MLPRTVALVVTTVFFLGCNYDLSKVKRPGSPGDAKKDAPGDAAPDRPATDARPDGNKDGPVGDQKTHDGPAKDKAAGDGPAKDKAAGDGPVKPDSGPKPPTQVCSADKWCWVNSLPQGNTMRGIWGSSATSVFAVGGAGTVMRYDGAKWSFSTGGTTETLHGVWGSAHNDVYAVGEEGTIVYWNGSKWSPEISGVTTPLYGVWAAGAKYAIAVGEGAAVVHYHKGSGWAVDKKLTAKGNLNDVWGLSPTYIVAVGDKGMVAQYDGNTWSVGAFQSAQLRGVWGTAATNFYVVGDNGTLGHYTAMGFGPPVNTGTKETLRHVWGTGPSDVYAMGDKGTLLHTSNGTKWTQVTGHGAKVALRAMWGSGPSDLHMAGEAGTMLRFDGKAWTDLRKGETTSAVRGVWAGSTANVHAATLDGELLRFDGAKWHKQTVAKHAFYTMWGDSASNVWAGGNAAQGSGTLRYPRARRFDGKGWSDASKQLLGNSQSYASAFWGVGPTNVWSVVTGNTLSRRFRWDGTKWNDVGIAYHKGLHGLWGTIPLVLYTIDTKVGLMRDLGGTGGWTKVASLTGSYRWIWGSDAKNIFLVGQQGAILHFDGKNTTGMTSGTKNDLWGAWGISKSDVYAVGARGTIVHYDGSSWKSMASGCEHDLRAIWGTKSGHVFVAGDGGTMLLRSP